MTKSRKQQAKKVEGEALEAAQTQADEQEEVVEQAVEQADPVEVTEPAAPEEVATEEAVVEEAPAEVAEEAPVERGLDEVVSEALEGQELDEAVSAQESEDAPLLSEADEALVRAAFDPEEDTKEGEEPSMWEERFEGQINAFFDEAIARVPGFVDRNLRSFRRIMGRSLSPRTGLADIFVGVRNVAAGVSKTVGGPDFSTSSYTHDALTKAFEREVVSGQELESLLSRLFAEFEESQWAKVIESSAPGQLDEAEIDALRHRLARGMEKEIAHDPLLAQAIRSGLKLGIPASLGYVLFGKGALPGGLNMEKAAEVYKKNLKFYGKILGKLGKFEIPSWLGAVGWAGGVLGSLALGGVVEYAINNVRDVKGAYIRQLNAARYILLYGDNPEESSGQGLLHIVRGLERQFERVSPETTPLLAAEVAQV